MTIKVYNKKLNSLICSQENDELDFKSADLLIKPSGKNCYKIAKHLVGFVNHRGGKLIFGVDDNGTPEGKHIREEEALRTISEIIDARISPPIDFKYSYFTADNDDLSDGSILIVELQRRSSPIPHAIIEKSEGEIRKREYRIRAGESTKLVSNNELLALFEGRDRTNLKTSETLHFLLDEIYSPAETKYKPQYQATFDRHFEELGSEDELLIEKIIQDCEFGSRDAQKRIVDAQYALTISTILNSFEFILVSNIQLNERLDDQIDSPTFSLKSIEPSDIILPEGSNPLIEETRMQKLGILPKYDPDLDHFKIPAGAKISIWDDFQGFDIHNDHFSLSFSVDLVEVGVGLPTRHPDSEPQVQEYGWRRQDHSNCTMDAHISVEADFKYPNQDYSEFESYRSYCETMIEVFDSTFDWEDYTDNLPNSRLINVEDKVDQIYEELQQLQEDQSE